MVLNLQKPNGEAIVLIDDIQGDLDGSTDSFKRDRRCHRDSGDDGLDCLPVVLKYWLTRKRSQPVNMPGYDPEALAKLQASVDAISIEVERISEGQRFTTRLLNDRAAETTPV
jgi:hypothetical protein